jgi:hypothetical protein
MYIVRGAYHFRPNRVAFRDDYCLSCRALRRSIAIRSFDVGHIFWIPILPVGFWRHWECSVCGRKPHGKSKARRYVRWAGLYSLIGASIMFWTLPVDSGFAVGSWFVRIAAPGGALLLLFFLIRVAREPSLRQKLASIQPTADTTCPFCSIPLVAGTGERWSCPFCNIVRY